MTQILINAPNIEPVTLAQAKDWLKIEGTSEDTLVSTLIVSSRLVIEQATRRMLITQTWRLLLDVWPDGTCVEFPVGPVQDIASIRVRDLAGNAAAVDASAYVADLHRDPARVVFVSPPPSPAWPVSGIEIDVVAGYGDSADNVPQPLRQAMLMLIARWHQNRGDALADASGMALPDPVVALIGPYRRARLQ